MGGEISSGPLAQQRLIRLGARLVLDPLLDDFLAKDDYWRSHQAYSRLVKRLTGKSLRHALLERIGRSPTKTIVQKINLERVLCAYLYTADLAHWPVSPLRRYKAKVLKPLRELATSGGDRIMCAIAIRALGRLRDRESLQLLMKDVLNDGKDDIRVAAAEALGEFRDRAAVPSLMGRLMREFNEDVRNAICDALVKVGTPAVKPLIAALGRERFLRRGDLAYVLGRIKDPRAVEPLLKAMDSPHLGLAIEAGIALGAMREPRAVKKIIEKLLLLEHAPSQMQIAEQTLIVTLGIIDTPEAIEEVLRWKNHSSPRMRKAVADALKESRDEDLALPVLDEMMKTDRDVDVQRAARGALVAIGMRQPEIKSHHFPLHIRMALKQRLGKQAADLGLTPKDIADLVDRKGFAQWARGKGISKAPPKMLRAVSRTLRRLVGEDKHIGVKKVRALLDFHEQAHAILAARKDIVREIGDALFYGLGWNDYEELQRGFTANYGHASLNAPFVEELIVTYYQELWLLGNPVRVLPPSARGLRDPGKIKSLRMPIPSQVGTIIEAAMRSKAYEIKFLAYHSPFREQFLKAMRKGARAP